MAGRSCKLCQPMFLIIRITLDSWLLSPVTRAHAYGAGRCRIFLGQRCSWPFKLFRTHENKMADPLSQFHLTNRVVL